jgi:hypothetical protein
MIWHGVLLSPSLGFPIVGRLADSMFFLGRLIAHITNRGRGEEDLGALCIILGTAQIS